MVSALGEELEVKVLTFQVGPWTYGIPLAWVCAVEVRDRGGEIKSKTYDFRGERLPVVDLAGLFGSASSRGLNLLILGRGTAEAAAVVDSPGVVVGAQEVYKLPVLCQSLMDNTFNGVLVKEEEIILMVDPKHLCQKRDGEGRRIARGGEGL